MSDQARRSGGGSAGQAFDAREFLESLRPTHLSIN